jgi:hypothetical protein
MNGFGIVVGLILSVFSLNAQAKVPAETEISKYLLKTLKIEKDDASRYLLSHQKLEEIRIGFGSDIYAEDGKLNENVREALLSTFAPESAKVLHKLFLAAGRDRYANAMLIGPAGAGKSFTIDQLVTLLTFGMVPEFLEIQFGLRENDSPFLKDLRDGLLENTQIVVIDHDLLSLDNTKPGNAFAKADVRMRALLADIFRKAREDFETNKIRTVFILEEVATLPPLVQQTLKRLLDRTGFKTSSATKIEKGQESGYSVIAVTTPPEYRKMIEADSAVERRYEKVDLLEPSEEEALAVMKRKRDSFTNRYGFVLADDVLVYLISMRKLFANPPLAMPDSVLKILDGLMLWATDPRNRKHDIEITIGEAYEYLVRQSHLPAETWLPTGDNRPPLWNLTDRVKQHVIGQDAAVEQITKRLKTGRTTAFREVPVFFLMGPSASGKNTIVSAINQEMFGHDGAHLKFDLSGSTESRMRMIFEVGPDGGLPLLVQAFDNGPPNGAIILDEGKDLPSDQFDILKTVVEDGIIRPKGIDTRPRPLGLNAIFIMGQWGEELFEGKSDIEIARILKTTDERQLVEILKKGSADRRKGAVPMALIQRAIRSGGLVLLPPVRKSLYAEIVKLSLKDVIDNFKRTSQVVLSVGDDLVGAVADIGVQNSMSPRGLDGVLKDLTETAIMEAQDEGLPMRGVILNLKLNEQRTEVVVQRLSEGKVANEYKSPVKSLLRSRCSSLLETTENETGRK